MDLCLSCKACKTECPANVDLAKLKAEWQHAFYEHRMRPLGHLLVKNIHRLSPPAARFATLSNWFGRRSLVRRVMESITGIDRRRSLPEIHRDHFRRWFARRTPDASPGVLHRHPRTGVRGSPKVVLLDDCFTTYQEPRIGRSAVTLLERAGFQVDLAGVCCGRAMISKGFLTDARRLAKEGIAKLDAHAAAGVPILGLEPSCILTLADEWPELVPGPAASASRPPPNWPKRGSRSASATMGYRSTYRPLRERCCSMPTAIRRPWLVHREARMPCASSPTWRLMCSTRVAVGWQVPSATRGSTTM